MAIYHDPETKEQTFAGGTMSQALGRHRLQKGSQKSNLGGDNKQQVLDHLHKASEHLQHATEMHTKGTLSETQQKDPRKVDEEAEAPAMGEPGGEGMRGSLGASMHTS